jgi:hypothetical protein
MKIRTSLREALNDPRLLGKALEGDSWSTWRTLLLASMGEPLSNDELAVFRAVTGRAQAPTEPCEELVAVIGRRGGKSRAVAVLAAYLATLIDYKDCWSRASAACCSVSHPMLSRPASFTAISPASSVRVNCCGRCSTVPRPRPYA